MNIMIVDDHALFREGLASMLKPQPDIKVVAEAGSAQEAVRAALKFCPDVILLDLGLPDGNGLEAMQKILAALPDTKICILTVHQDSKMMLTALRMGAKGYLLKNLTITKLLSSVRALARGEVALSRTDMAEVLEDYARMGILAGIPQVLKSLTMREMEVLEQIGSGASNQEIADRLVISVNTVKIHIHNILSKLGLEDRAEAVSLARRHGLYDPVATQEILSLNNSK